MKSSSKKKRAALNVKKAVKIKKTAKRRRSSAKETARALTRAQKKLPVSRSSKPSSSGLRDNVAANPVKLFWIIISNIHEKVAYEDIVRAIFQRCVKLRSNSNPSNLGGHFQDTIEVAFETKEDAVKAVNLYLGRIKLFRKTWTIHHHKPSAASSSGLRISDIQEAAEASRICCFAGIFFSDMPKGKQIYGSVHELPYLWCRPYASINIEKR